MKQVYYILIVIAIIVVVGFLISNGIESDKQEINKWANSKNLEVKNIDVHFTIINTPFYYLNKGSRIYEVDMSNNEKWWIRTGVFSWDYEKDKSK